MKFDTKVVRGGITPDPTTGAIVPPIYQTATYVLDEIGVDKGFDYTRASNPTRQMLEEQRYQPMHMVRTAIRRPCSNGFIGSTV